MICPKCGFDQPDGHECVKCGVVIAKYISALRRREDANSKPSTGPAAALDYAPAEALNLDLQDIKAESQRLWGEISYINTDKNLLREEMHNLRKRDENLAHAIAQCAGQADIRKIAQDLADVSRHLTSLRTTFDDLSGIVAHLRDAAAHYPALAQEVDRIRTELSQMAQIHQAHDDVRNQILQIAKEVDVLKTWMADKFDHVVSADQWHATITELRSELDPFRSEVQRTREALSTLDAYQADCRRLATEVLELKDALARLRSEFSALHTLAQDSSPAEWDLLREQLRAELQDLVSSRDHVLSATLESTLQAEVRPLRENLATLAPKVAEVDHLKDSLADVTSQLAQSGARPTDQTTDDLRALQHRCEGLTSKMVELDHLKESFADLTLRMDQSAATRPDLTALAPRLETLEAFHKSIAQTLQNLSGAESPETQLQALTQWAERIKPSLSAKAAPEMGPDLRELKDDIKLIKILLSDLIQRSGKEASSRA